MLHDSRPSQANAPLSHGADMMYRPDIDGLRALAVMSVVLYHAFPSTFSGGFIGVDIFFVISGYLISSIIIGDVRRERFSLFEFYCKRARRIFPALLTVLVVSLALGMFVLLPEELQNLGKHVGGAAIFVSNFVLWQEAGYFDVSSIYKPLLHLWSLGVEEQFYLLWPCVLVMALRWKRCLEIIPALFLASFAVELYLTATSQNAAFYLPHSRFWELLAGAMLAYMVQERRVHCTSGAYAEIIVSASLVATVILVLILDDSIAFPGYVALAPVALATVLICFGKTSAVSKIIFSNRLMVSIGLISYPLYLWHWPVLSFMTIIKAKNPGFNARIYAILISFALAYATYRLIELPLRSSGRLRVLAARLVAVMALLGCFGWGVYLSGGLPWRPMSTDAVNRNAFTWENGRNANKACISAVAPANFPFCMMSKKYPPSVIMLGDSHANALFPFFEAYFEKQHRGVVMLGKGGCPPFLDVEKNDFACPEIMLNSLKYIEAHPEIRDVYLVARFAETESGDNYFEKSSVENHMTLITDKGLRDRREIFRIALENTLRYFDDKKKSVRIVLSIPELNFDPKTCLEARGGVDCTTARNLVDQRQAPYRKIVSEIAKSHNVPLIDPLDVFCDESKCIAKSDGRILYRDFHHLGLFGNDYLLEREFKLN